MKKLKVFTGNKGFTLVELIVALLVTGLLLGTISAVFFMSQKIYTRGENTSYKQKSITNVETDLQNSLSRATSVIVKDVPDGDYNLGFNAQGQCVENIDGVEYRADEISGITLQVQAKNSGDTSPYTMNYELGPRDITMSTLVGGIVMNNMTINNFTASAFASPVILDGITKKYLTVNYGRIKDTVPKTLVEQMITTYYDYANIVLATYTGTYTQQTDAKNNALIAAGFVKTDGTAVSFPSNDIFRSRVFYKWYKAIGSGTFPSFDSDNYVYATDNLTKPTKQLGYLQPYCFGPFSNTSYDIDYNKHPQVYLFVGLTSGTTVNWNTKFIFLPDSLESSDSIGSWYYNTKITATYLAGTYTYQSLSDTIHTSVTNNDGIWVKLVRIN